MLDSVPRNLSYLYCGLVEEFCEFRSAVKLLEEREEEEELKRKEDVSSSEESPEVGTKRLGVLKELGDVTWYLSAMCNELGVELESVVQVGQQSEEDSTLKLSPVSSPDLANLLDQVLSQIGTIGGKVKKSIRDDNETITEEKKEVIVQCIREIFRVINEGLCPLYKSSLLDVMRLNAAKAASRFARGVVQGDGDNR